MGPKFHPEMRSFECTGAELHSFLDHLNAAGIAVDQPRAFGWKAETGTLYQIDLLDGVEVSPELGKAVIDSFLAGRKTTL